MKISTEIFSSALLVGEERAIEYIARAGFDAWDFSMFRMCKRKDHPLSGPDYLKFARILKRIGEENGIRCNQSHAPFPTANAEIRSYLKRAIECTAEAGGEICVIHPDNNASAQKNAEMYFELLPFAKEHGVRIATENMWNWSTERDEALPAACSSHEDFKAHLDAVNDGYFVACLDIGHAEMRGLGTSALKMIERLGGKVQALHIHDNDRWHDSHMIPFSMNIDFEPIVRKLKEIGYNGYFTLEADAFLKNRGCTAENVFDGIKEMAAAAKRMAQLFDAM